MLRQYASVRYKQTNNSTLILPSVYPYTDVLQHCTLNTGTVPSPVNKYHRNSILGSDLNPRPLLFQSSVLPTRLPRLEVARGISYKQYMNLLLVLNSRCVPTVPGLRSTKMPVEQAWDLMHQSVAQSNHTISGDISLLFDQITNLHLSNKLISQIHHYPTVILNLEYTEKQGSNTLRNIQKTTGLAA